jgi:tetratricopeptide (TPR) repeat protein
MTPEELKTKTDELIKEKKYDDCIKLCKRVLKKEENNDVAHNPLGLCYLNQATENFTKALAINPKNKEAQENFAKSVPSMPVEKWQPRLAIGILVFSLYYVYRLLDMNYLNFTTASQFGILVQLLPVFISIGLYFLLDKFFDRLRDLLVIFRINSVVVAFIIYWILFYGYNFQFTQNPDLNLILTIFVTVWLWLVIKEVFDEIYERIVGYSAKISVDV